MIPKHGRNMVQDLPRSRIFFVGLAISTVKALLEEFFQNITLPATGGSWEYHRSHLDEDLRRLPESFEDQGYVLVAQDPASFLILSRDGDRFFLATVPYEGVEDKIPYPHEGGLSLPVMKGADDTQVE